MIFYYLLRIILYPVICILCVFNKKLRERYVFERFVNNSNIISPVAFDVAFEFSSEGELELAKPVIQHALDRGDKVELIFSSDSVYKAALGIQKKYPNQVRILCLPIVSFTPFGSSFIKNWVTAKRFILTRYDFFPEIIDCGSDKEFILISGSLKKFMSNPKKIKQLYLRWVYKSFDKILMATDIEKENLNSLGIEHKDIQSFDFRPFQILSRINNIDTDNSLLSSIFVSLKKDKRKKIILGSFWADEVEFLKNPPADFFDRFQLVLVPHKLDAYNIEACKSVLSDIFSREVSVYSKSGSITDITILDYKGILCELYQFFDYSYVAGGFRSSVHSLLEPFLSNSKVLCGPSISKSTEYDMILEIDKRKISILETLSFYDELTKGEVDCEKVDHYKSTVDTDHKKYISWVLN